MRKDIRMGVVEELEREKRRSNLVLMGVPEEGEWGEGREIVLDVVNGLVPEVNVEFVIIGRIGKKGNAARPVRIRVEDQGHRRKLLSRAKELKGREGFQRIYIVPDLTRVQQEEDKALRDEVRRLRVAGENGVRIEKGVVVIRKPMRVVETNAQAEGEQSTQEI
jgi:nitrogen fixation/metabolism regulation signal transduction histidine kinase